MLFTLSPGMRFYIIRLILQIIRDILELDKIYILYLCVSFDMIVELTRCILELNTDLSI